jgi:hypothetical protein
MASHSDQKDLQALTAVQDVTAKPDVLHLDNLEAKGTTADWQQLLRDAELSEEEEKKMPLMVAFRVYPKAVGWTFAVTLMFVM